MFHAQIIFTYFLIFTFNCLQSTIIHEINQAVFLDPRTHSAYIQCPLESPTISATDIQWYDVTNRRYETNHGRFYLINGSQPIDREFICSTNSQTDDKYRIKIRTYDRPLTIRHLFIRNLTNTSLTIEWEDDQYNQQANITYYELVLKMNNTIQYRTLVNGSLTLYTFPSLYPNTSYSIDISAVDIWKRYSSSKTINSTTLSTNINEMKKSSQSLDRYFLQKTLSCYRLDHQLLLIEYNRSDLFSTYFLYNLTVYDYQDHIVSTDNYYNSDEKTYLTNEQFHSFLYRFKRKSYTYKIQILFFNEQINSFEYLTKYCDDFYPTYSPLTCSIKSKSTKENHLILNMQLSSMNKQIFSVKPTFIFYRTSRTNMIKKNLFEIHRYVSANIDDVKENYSALIENNIVGPNMNEKINVSIHCPITRIGLCRK